MRKQDRIRNQEQSRSQQQTENQSQPEPKKEERVKGSASENPPSRPPRQAGKLPLPD